MKTTNYFRPNWSQINKAIQDPDLRAEMNKQLHDLTQKIKNKRNDHWRSERKAVQDAKIAAIKSLPPGHSVSFTGNFSKLLGKEGAIAKHGRTRVSVDFGGDLGKWNVYYHELSTEAMDKVDLAGKKAALRITERLNRVL